MRNNSPLRYPGGKSVLTDLLRRIRYINGLGNLSLAEPFAGGAGASISMLFLEETPDIFINDIDNGIFYFWWSIIFKNESFQNLLQNIPVDISEWSKQHNIYRSKNKNRLLYGFATFYLNRCNRSGIIINGGPIGGARQEGKWRIDARFNRKELARRIWKINEYRERIHLSHMDGINFIKNNKENIFFFIDPPYFQKGNTLYLNLLDDNYHNELCNLLKTMDGIPWVLTYDDCPEIIKLYRGWAKIKPFSIKYSAYQKNNGKELLITPKWMLLPKKQASEAFYWS